MHDDYKPRAEFLELFPPTSGNEVNGLGETEVRAPSPFFWHPVDEHPWGELATQVNLVFRESPYVAQYFSPDPPGGRGPDPIPVGKEVSEDAPANFSNAIKQFALQDEADLVGITSMKPGYVYEGYSIDEPWIIIVGVAMDYDLLSTVPASNDNPEGAAEVGRQYNRAARASRQLVNFIRSQGYSAKAYEGPNASAINMIPAAIEAGLGQLGKHGSMINDIYGSNFRLSAVVTEMPLLPDAPVDIGVDDFCTHCQVCSNACPPGAIFNEKQLVRGETKWYVNFDACIPYFGETLGCGICIARCPWSIPERAPVIKDKMLRRRTRRAERGE